MKPTSRLLPLHLLLTLCLFVPSFIAAYTQAQESAFYVGNAGKEVFNDVVQLSDGTILIAGAADDMEWLSDQVSLIELGNTEMIANDQGTNHYAFLLHTTADLSEILNVIHLPLGSAEDIRFIKSTNAPRTETGELFISGNTQDSEDGGYFIGKLNNNFVGGIPTAFEWTCNVKCTADDYPKKYQPWDVDAEGRVYFVRGDSHDWSWSAMYRLDVNGALDVVDHWRTHWKVAGGEFRGTPASSYVGGIDSIDYSGIVFKRDQRCNLRSWTQADYELVQPDGNGGTKQGLWPLDVLFDGPCDPAGDAPTNGPGYTGYSPGGGATYGPSSVCVDRRSGALYVGFNAKSILPDGNPDFEPAVMKMDSEGALLWWSRLYHEVRSDGSIHNSSPDQYIDALAIDYALPLPNSSLVVNARCHGNNVENLWEGNTIAADPDLYSYQNQFTGSTGNIHISWLGKLDTENGDLQHSTYLGEMGQSTTGIGDPHPNPLINGWPNPNDAWMTLNTTRMVQNTLKVTTDGSVLVIGLARRPMTTSNAYLSMPNPYYEGYSAWSSFVRQYNADFSVPQYSSIIRGVWDTLATEPPYNVNLYNVFKTEQGILVVGKHDGTGENMPTANVPEWGSSSAEGESAVIAHFVAPEIINEEDSPVTDVISATAEIIKTNAPRIYPNPTADRLFVRSDKAIERLTVLNVYGQLVHQVDTGINEVDLSTLPNAYYFVKVEDVEGRVFMLSVLKE